MQFIKSPNFTYKKRRNIKIIVIHKSYGGFIDTLKDFTNKQSGWSAHYLISRKGQIIQLVKDNNIAWHVPVVTNKKLAKIFPNPNFASLAIECVDDNLENFWTSFQVKSLRNLLKIISKKYNIPLVRKNVLTHSDFDPINKKNDPGKDTPWENFLTN